MGPQVVGRADAEQPACEPGVIKVQLRHLHEPLDDSGVKDGQPKDDEARLQDREPGLRGRLGNNERGIGRQKNIVGLQQNLWVKTRLA
jgi:hypothetical protein